MDDMVNIIKYLKMKKENGENGEGENEYEIIESCPECQSKDIIFDYHKKESYCADCGLIVKDYELLSISDYQYFLEVEAERQRHGVNNHIDN